MEDDSCAIECWGPSLAAELSVLFYSETWNLAVGTGGFTKFYE